MKVNFRVDPKHAIKRRLEINLTLDPASVFVDPPNWLYKVSAALPGCRSGQPDSRSPDRAGRPEAAGHQQGEQPAGPAGHPGHPGEELWGEGQ